MVTVSRMRDFYHQQRGASILEALVSMAIVAMAAPFVYTQIAQTNRDITNMRLAREIIATRDTVLNFVRMNQDTWPDSAQIKLSAEELENISPIATAGFIDKYSLRGATATDVYLAFDFGMDAARGARIANDIGTDGAVVGADGIAYGDAWAVTAPDFAPGNVIYRIAHDFFGEDRDRYLHRGSSGEDNLNVMMRDLNMGGYNVFDVGTVSGDAGRISDISATFVTAADLTADAVYFSRGANVDGATVDLGAMRVTGDVTGFRNINAAVMNDNGYSTDGRIITDRATITNSVNVARDLTLKSDTLRTVSGFAGITTNSVITPFISAEEMIFYENFGLTVSGELLMSTTAPIKIGRWTFPSTTPPRFSEFTLTRASIPAAPGKKEFGRLMSDGWQTYRPIQ